MTARLSDILLALFAWSRVDPNGLNHDLLVRDFRWKRFKWEDRRRNDMLIDYATTKDDYYKSKANISRHLKKLGYLPIPYGSDAENWWNKTQEEERQNGFPEKPL
ncbi:hypothetical protein BDV96DRAFT_596665 [Lophiotrema nucula]|uniref:Uncharacterized protein n=1 Tax=Lophiotrema nucula TaxID=690887 RepID=A0A6A5ZH37_9PLEO|nr:hypothetical protein BDV96DRAFT_596665 [Lophiotrema nucula]